MKTIYYHEGMSDAQMPDVRNLSDGQLYISYPDVHCILVGDEQYQGDPNAIKITVDDIEYESLLSRHNIGEWDTFYDKKKKSIVGKPPRKYMELERAYIASLEVQELEKASILLFIKGEEMSIVQKTALAGANKILSRYTKKYIETVEIEEL